ncbi:Fidgetin-like protein 1 [Fusarium oxysporum f. sp. cubense race 1]|uniref:Fidgetin-like protein 1 n=1 Tax=Fusarium oxysporum f. sp. cubense (strain race 1) TaxID=1229664 RepID=N4UBL3_FUSC1|nr:Fidgetin-like protein 1 [Fusarium oxysporum f. sp. cubense race 1]
MTTDTMDSTKSSGDESTIILTPADTEPKEETTETKTEQKTADSKTEDSKTEETPKEDEEKKEKVMVGLLTESKDLYAKFDKNGDRSWTDKYPDDLEEAAENEETQKYAVIIRKRKPKEADSNKPLDIDSLVIQSPYLKRVLGKVFEDYPGIVTDVSRLKFHAPFECFVHRWGQFTAAKDDPNYDQITREHVSLLHKIMRDELGEIIQLREDYFKNRAVAFEHVWTLFPPGCTVWGSVKGRPVAVRFDSGYLAKTQCGGLAYMMNCKGIDWDGRSMGWCDITMQINDFPGTAPFSSLSCYPLEYHPNHDQARNMLLERGRKFESLAGYHYKAYSGTAIWWVNATKSRKETVNSRIVIDGANWEKQNPDHTVWLNYLTGDGPVASSDRDSDAGNDDDDEDYYSDCYNDSGVKKPEFDDDQRAPLSEEQLIMTSPMVRGYALKNKRWMEFFIDDVTEVKFNEKAFDSLVLPADQKELILAFAQSQVKFKNVFDDIISGKGKGIIMLLSGGPGIGKTLTAESVAEEMKVPLYIMSAGDLGSDAYDIEENLQRILEMVANWNAVLLLDECDVFLEARSAHDIERNRIVSIFLRMLEYYEGILFLTTNRVKDMDQAFQSRIHMSLEYPPLDNTARESVWRGFLSRAISVDAKIEGESAHEITEGEIKALAGLELNGRQIKNVLKTANLLACHKGEKLAFTHLRTVLRVEGHSL